MILEMPKPYSEREINPNKFVHNFTGVLYWGKTIQPSSFRSPWASAEEMIPNKINAIEKEKDISVIGFGGDFEEAYHSCLAKLEEKLDNWGGDFVLIGNGLPLKNGANAQCHLSAKLYKIERENQTIRTHQP